MGRPKRNYLTGLGWFFGAALLASLLTSPGLQAQKEDSITLGPVLFDFAIQPGQEAELELRLFNHSPETRRVRIYTENFQVRGEEYRHEYGVPGDITNPAEWIEFGAETYALASGEQTIVPFLIQVPSDVPPGGHYAVIFAETLPIAGSDTPAVEQHVRIGSLVYVEATGTIHKEGSLSGFKSSFWQRQAPLRSALRITNSGQSHFRVFGQFTYRGLFSYHNRTIIGAVLPDTTRRFELEEPNLPYGLYLVSGSAELLGETFKLPRNVVLYMPLSHGLGILGLTALITLLYRRHHNIQVRRNLNTKVVQKPKSSPKSKLKSNQLPKPTTPQKQKPTQTKKSSRKPRKK